MSFFKVLLASILGFFISLALLFLILFGMTVGLIVGAGEPEAPVARNSVLEIDLSQGLTEYPGAVSMKGIFEGNLGEMTLRSFLAGLERAQTDDRIVAVRILASGFSGSWSMAEEIREALLALKAAGKPIYATSNANGLSESDYFIASSADSIYLKPSAQLEINGIGATLMFFKPALDKLGIKAETVRAGKFKNAIEPFILDSASQETAEMMRAIVDSTFARFVSTVSSSRGIATDRLDMLLNRQGLLSATEAHRERLVDGVLYEDQIARRLKSRLGLNEDERLPSISMKEYARGDDEETAPGQIAIVYATGTIITGESSDDFSPLSQGASVGDETFREAMESARESGAVKAVVLRIDSPGGAATASEEMWREIRLTAEQKPVIASMSSVAASGGYYIAVAADTIVADATSLTGSIGVFGMWFDASRFFRETLGINTQVIASDSLADMMSMFRTPTALERSVMQEMVDTVYQRFLQVVAAGRGMTTTRVHELGQGRVYTGAEAKRLGLIDEIGGLNRALQIAAAMGKLDSGYSVRILPRPKSFLETIASSFGQEIATLGYATDPHQALVREVKRRSGVQMRSVEAVVR